MAAVITFNCRYNSKCYGLKVTKEEMKKAILKAGFKPNMRLDEFHRLKLKIKDKEFTAQTLLRHFETGSRGTKNIIQFLSKIGLDHVPYDSRFEFFDFTDPKRLRSILLKSKIDVQAYSVTRFIRSKLILDKDKQIEITGKRFLREYQKVLIKKDMLKLSSYPYSKSLYIDLLNRAGFTANLYNPFPNKSLLRRIFESANFDFENERFKVSQFLRMKFKAYGILDGRNDGFFTGEGLLYHYYRKNASWRFEQILDLLQHAGYDVSHMRMFNASIKAKYNLYEISHSIAKDILSSSNTKIDWNSVSRAKFEKIHFNSKFFVGGGNTLLRLLGGVKLSIMKKFLEIAGYKK